MESEKCDRTSENGVLTNRNVYILSDFTLGYLPQMLAKKSGPCLTTHFTLDKI